MLNIIAALNSIPTQGKKDQIPQSDIAFLDSLNISQALRAAAERCRQKIPQRQAILQEQMQLDRQNYISKIGTMDIPQIMRTAILTNKDERGEILKNRDQDKLLQAELRAKKRLLLLTGKPSTGRTLTACRRLADQSYGYYVVASCFLALVPELRENNAELAKYERSSFLVLDDIGRGGGETEKHRSRICGLLCGRHDQGLITIAITDKSAQKFFGDYGEVLFKKIARSGAHIECLEEIGLGR